MAVRADGTVSMPKYERLRRAILAEYVESAPAGVALPTERDLAARYEVNRATVRQAIAALEDAGLVYRIQGAGTFTVGPTIAKSLKMTSFTEDVTARGQTPGSIVVSVLVQPAGAQVGQDLRISPVENVVKLVRVRTANTAPMCLEEVYIRADQAPGLADRDLSGSLYAVLAGDYGIRLARADQIVQATVLEPAEAALLDAPPLSPALRVRRIGLDNRDTPIERTMSLYRADRYEIRFAVRRD